MTRIGPWLSAAWQLVTHDLGNFALLALVYILVMIVAWVIPYVGHLVLNGPVAVAVFAVTLHRVRTGRFEFNLLETGGRLFVPAFLAGLLVSIFTSLGFALLIIPGLVVMAWYLFPFLLIVDRRRDFWEAMEESRLLVSRDLGGFFVFVLALLGINILGALALGLGLLISLPVTWVAITLAYQELWPAPAEQTGPAPEQLPPAGP